MFGVSENKRRRPATGPCRRNMTKTNVVPHHMNVVDATRQMRRRNAERVDKEESDVDSMSGQVADNSVARRTNVCGATSK